jgi:hypothetical protein
MPNAGKSKDRSRTKMNRGGCIKTHATD